MQLNQGRAAMLGITGAMIQEGIQGQTLAEHIATANDSLLGPAHGSILIPGII